MVLHVYEATGRASAGVNIKVHAELASVHEADLLENAGSELRTEQNSFQFDLHPYEIKTFKLRLRPLQTRP